MKYSLLFALCMLVVYTHAALPIYIRDECTVTYNDYLPDRKCNGDQPPGTPDDRKRQSIVSCNVNSDDNKGYGQISVTFPGSNGDVVVYNTNVNNPQTSTSQVKSWLENNAVGKKPVCFHYTANNRSTVYLNDQNSLAGPCSWRGTYVYVAGGTSYCDCNSGAGTDCSEAPDLSSTSTAGTIIASCLAVIVGLIAAL